MVQGRGSKGAWTAEETRDLETAISECEGGDLVLAGHPHRTYFWNEVEERLGNGRTSGQCHEKFQNDLR